MENTETLSSDFSFESHYVRVLGSNLHYIDEGRGLPILFLHGNPTSSYLWRNIIPHLSRHGRCIALDLIGMGKSDKPDLPYRFFDHYRYLEHFISLLNLKHITLVMHDWGSALGFHYAQMHEHHVRGLAFMEAMVKTFNWSDFDKQFRIGFKLMRKPLVGWLLISVFNIFINRVLPRAVVRNLTPEEMQHYRQPFPTIESRKAVRRWPCEIPIDGSPADMNKVVTAYSYWLQKTSLPKLLIYASPGAIINARSLQWCRENIRGLQSIDIGEGIHYLQEDHPHRIGTELAKWYLSLDSHKTV